MKLQPTLNNWLHKDSDHLAALTCEPERYALKIMEWMNQADFWERIEKGPNPIKIDSIGWCYFLIPESDLREKIGDIEPSKDLRDEDAPPGPVSRWYGNLNGIPVILDFHHSHPNGDVVEIHHGDMIGSREAVRDYFIIWGRDWKESKIA